MWPSEGRSVFRSSGPIGAIRSESLDPAGGPMVSSVDPSRRPALPLVGPLFVEESDGYALAALGARIDSAVEPDRCRGCRICLIRLRLRFEPHHQDMLVAVVMGEPRLHPDTEEFRPTDRRDDAYLVVGAVDERRGFGTQRSQRFGQLRRGHLGLKSKSSKRLSEPSPRLARLLFKTEDQLEDRVGGFGPCSHVSQSRAAREGQLVGGQRRLSSSRRHHARAAHARPKRSYWGIRLDLELTIESKGRGL
jgi:hypothetical protein